MPRTFIALPISREAEENLLEAQNEIKKIYPEALIKWTERGNFHLTLEFLGEIKDSDIFRVEDALQLIVANYPPIRYSLGILSGFPNLHHPNVLVVQVIDKEKTGFVLRQDIHEQLQNLGLSDNGRPWKPHLTLGRLPEPLKLPSLAKIKVRPASWTANQVFFYESDLTKSGSIYQMISKYDLLEK